MGKMLKVLAILMLLATIAGAGLVLYGINTMQPVIELTAVNATPASQAQEVFDAALAQLRDGTFAGRTFAAADGLTADNCTFLTYTVRMRNRGFFPAEWISLEIQPQASADAGAYDVLQLDNNGAYVLGAGTQGDLAATILHAGDAQQTQRAFTVTCYVFGKQITVQGTAQ